MSNNKDDLFEEALNNSIKASIESSISVSKPDKNGETTDKIDLLSQAKDIASQPKEDGWNKLKEKINNGYAEKAMVILENMPDRDFFKNYLKLMEYVNPKITRKEKLDKKEEHNHIKITIHNHEKNNESSDDNIIIDVTPD